MGESGCEVAKDSSDIIFLDDNFNSVFKATLWGRSILDNIRKFV
jgi:Ca2+-transporting ATPase